MKKKIGFFILAFGVVALMTACSLPGAETEESGTMTQAEDIIVEDVADEKSDSEDIVLEDAEADADNMASPVGTYCYKSEEEIEGTIVEYTDWLVLNEDGTGVISASDSVNIKWHDDVIEYEDGNTQTMQIKDSSIVLDDGYSIIEYTKTDEKMPEELMPNQ